LDLKEEKALTDVSREEMNDIQWLKAKYGKMLEREGKLLGHVLEILGDFEYRLKVIEEKLE
jgi:hypothetical protein